MEDPLLGQFLQGDQGIIRDLKRVVQDFVAKTGGSNDDAREIFQIVALSIYERARRTPAQHLCKSFHVWLNKSRRAPLYVSEQVNRLASTLDKAFDQLPELKASLRRQEKEAAHQFTRIATEALTPFVTAEEGNPNDVSEITAAALAKGQKVILDFKGYFLKSCKNEWLRLKKNRGMISSEEQLTHMHMEENDEEEHREQKNLILNLLQKTSEVCQKLLRQLYMEGKSKEELLSVFGYSNPDSFDVAKSRCLSALRATVKQHPYFKRAGASQS